MEVGGLDRPSKADSNSSQEATKGNPSGRVPQWNLGTRSPLLSRTSPTETEHHKTDSLRH